MSILARKDPRAVLELPRPHPTEQVEVLLNAPYLYKDWECRAG